MAVLVVGVKPAGEEGERAGAGVAWAPTTLTAAAVVSADESGAAYWLRRMRVRMRMRMRKSRTLWGGCRWRP